MRRHRLALIVDPRFPGGTSTSVAAEIRALHDMVDLSVVAISTDMFKGCTINERISSALEDCGLELAWDPPVIHADTVVFHNPSCLKFNQTFGIRISCRKAYIATRENFLRPGGAEGFDVAHCLALIERALVTGQRLLAPVSAYNRRTVTAWCHQTGSDWMVADFDWFHICDFRMKPATRAPRDRRGRHSRAGFEKFPTMETMLTLFPPHAERCRILGGDSFLDEADGVPGHWDLLPFGALDVASFLESIDFFVYFTNPHWRESFGWVIAEAIAAGKVVITDPGTAEAFGPAAMAADPLDVDGIIRRFILEPDCYAAFVRTAQSHLERFRPRSFVQDVLSRALEPEVAADAVR